MGPRDFYLLIVVFGSMAAGLAYPDLGRPFSPAITPLLMVMLFLSLIFPLRMLGKRAER